MISRVVSTVRGGALHRTGKAHSRQSVQALKASSPEKSNASTEASSSTPADTPGETGTETSDETWKKPFSVAQIFGTYLQLAVWVVVLSVAGYTGIQKVCHPFLQHMP